MKVFQFVLCALIYQASYQAAVKERILFGNVVFGRTIQYQVLLRIKFIKILTGGPERFICGGALISEKYVLTAQHCINKFAYGYFTEAVAIGFGSNDSFELNEKLERSFEIGSFDNVQVSREWTLHPEYREFDLQADIAIIHLPQQVQFTDTIHPVKLPSWSDRDSKLTGKRALLTGWGKTERGEYSNTLLFAYVKISDKSECQRYNVKEFHICNVRVFPFINKPIACKADSGGPVVVDNKLVGIISYGKPALGTQSFDDCRTNAADAYTSVRFYLKWISDNTDIIIYD